MQILAEVGDLHEASVLDFGCGTGHLLRVLERDFQFRGHYVGFDLSAEMIELARSCNPRGTFQRRDIFKEGVGQDFDFVLVSGVFNNRLPDNMVFLHEALRLLFSHTRRALSFNALSNYVDFMDEGLFYADPEKVFAFCKEELSPSVALRHDYLVKDDSIPFEFTIYVRRIPCAVRTKLPAA